jgi:hypothetical protein
MPFQLNPDPQTLGITAPYLGRWFTSTNVSLPAPTAGSTLGLDLTLSGDDWRPPATGMFSLYVASPDDPPAALATLRDAKGQYPFPDQNRLIALYTLLPEVAARLRELLTQLPVLTGGAQQPPNANPSRLAVRTFAMALPTSITDVPGLMALIPDVSSSLPNDPTAQARYLGLDLKNGAIVNGDHPMTQLRRPGKFALPGDVLPTQEDIILQAVTGGVTLWAFDMRGRAIDPGAAAAWFSFLVNGSNQALALGGTDDWLSVGQDKRVCAFADGLILNVTNAHEGVLAAPFMGSSGRLQLGGLGVTNTVLVAGSSGTALSFSAAPNNPSAPAFNPAVDNAPDPRMALVPDGTYGSTVTLWPQGAVSTSLPRDFARVAVVDIEQHLVGIARGDSGTVPTDPNARRQADQNRPSTRTKVAACTGTGAVLLTTAEPAAALAVEAFSPGTSGRLVVGVADGQAGSLSSPLTALTADLPNSMVESTVDPITVGTYKVRALVGCQGTDPNTHQPTNQQVLLELNVGAPLAGAWLRAWPLGFDFDRGEHFRLDGGGGLVDATGTARLVMVLPDLVTVGPVGASALPSFDLMIVASTSSGTLRRRTYGDCRYDRPAVVTGSLVDTIDATMTWFVCETGKTGTGTTGLTDVVVPGATLLVKKSDGTFTLATRSKIPTTALAPATLMRALGSGAIVTLTQPAFKATPDRIDDRGLLQQSQVDGATTPGGIAAPGATGVNIDRTTRPGRGGSRLPASIPYPTQERLEVAASWVEGNDSHAMVGAADLLSRSHELLPHDAGHPGSAAGVETHGTGARLQGPAAVLAAEYVLDRTAGIGAPPPSSLQDFSAFWVRSEPALAIAASSTTFPSVAATAAGPWASVLKTNALGMEGLPAVDKLAQTAGLYPLSADVGRLESWLNQIPSSNNLGTRLVSGLLGSNTDAMLRALDRRIKTGAEGARDAAYSLKAAFSRAEDFVYIETPAIDLLAAGLATDPLGAIDALVDRLHTVPGLRLIICAAAQLPPGLPKPLTDVRDDGLLDVVNAHFRLVAPGRVALFAPGAGAGRSVRLASTTVIVDDAYALTGTTHLWRRGLTFDSSLAVSVFDERVTDGRPQEVRNFRRALLAGRLGIPVSLVPDDPPELAQAILDFDRTGSFRLAFHDIRRPDPFPGTVSYPTDEDRNVWNPDGSVADVSFADILAFFARASTPPTATVNDPLV